MSPKVRASLVVSGLVVGVLSLMLVPVSIWFITPLALLVVALITHLLYDWWLALVETFEHDERKEL